MQKLSLKVLLRFLGSYTHWNLVSGIGGFLFPIFESFRFDEQINIWISQVRRADCYHLYFVTKDSVGVTQFPTPRLADQRKATTENLGIIPFSESWAFEAHILFTIFFHSKRAIHPPPRWQDKGRKARRRGSKLAKNTVTDLVPMVKRCEAICRNSSNLFLTLQVPSPLCGDANFEQHGKGRLLVLADLRESWAGGGGRPLRAWADLGGEEQAQLPHLPRLGRWVRLHQPI